MFKKISINTKILQALKKFLLRVCKQIDDYEKEQIRFSINNLIFIAFKQDGVYLNGAKLIDKRAKGSRVD